MTVTAGQLYRSTHRVDVRWSKRQRRRVVRVQGEFAWLVSEDMNGDPIGRATRVRVRNGKLPGYRLRAPSVMVPS